MTFSVSPDVPPAGGDGEDFDSPLRGDLADPTKGAGLVAFDSGVTYPDGSVGATLETLDFTLRTDLANSSDAAKGAGLIGYSDGLGYADGTLGAAVEDVAATADASAAALTAFETLLLNPADGAEGAAVVGFEAGTDYSGAPNSAGAAIQTLNLLEPALANAASATKGAGKIGFLYSLAYTGSTVGAWLKGLATAAGSTLIGFLPGGAGGILRTVQDKGRERLTVFDKLTAAQRADVATGTPTLDLTSYIQTAVNEAVGRKLIINAGTYGVSFDAGNFGLAIDIPDNSYIEFEAGAEFKALAHNATIYQMLRVWDRTNVTIVHPRLDGNKAQNSATTGEFGMGIDIRGGSDVHIVDPYTVNCWGDGIYIGTSATSAVPKRVVVDSHYASGCRRQGCSLVSGIHITFNNPVWENISGVAPGAGIDIEPDSNLDELQDIRINNPRTKNNTLGIQVYLGALGGATAKKIDIEINGHVDDGSGVGANVGGANTAAGTHLIDGKITLSRPMWINSLAAAFQSVEHDALGPAIEVIRPSVIDPNRSGGSSPKYSSPFTVLRDTGSVLTYAIGNVRIVEPAVVLRSGSIPNLFAGQDVVNGASFVAGVFFLDPVKLIGMSNDAQRGFFLGQGNISDKYNIWGWNSTGSLTINGSYTSPINLANASMTVTIADPSAAGPIANSPDIIIRQPTGAQGTVATAAGGNFVGQVVGKQLRMTGAAGSYIRLKPLGANVYTPVEEVGAVTVV